MFAVSGALVAVRGRLDLFGTLVLAGATGLGGGLVRDVLLGDVPPPGLVDWRFLVTVRWPGSRRSCGTRRSRAGRTSS